MRRGHRLLAGTLIALVVPSVAAAQGPARTLLDWQLVARTGQPAPGGGSFGRLALAPRIADDGALWFASSAPFGAAPAYSVLRFTAEHGAEEVVAVEPPSTLSALQWSPPRLFSSPEGNAAWAEGFGPSAVVCGEPGVQVHQPREWLFGAPRDGEVGVVAMTGDAPAGAPGSFVARILGPSSHGFSGSFFQGPATSGPTGDRSPDAERHEALTVRAGGSSQFGRVDFVFERPAGSESAEGLFLPDAGFGRRAFVTAWDRPLVALDAAGRAVWLVDLASEPCFDVANAELPTRPAPMPCEDCIDPMPSELRGAVLAQVATGASVLVAREGMLLPGDSDADPRISQLGFWQAMDPSGGLFVHATLGGPDTPLSGGVGQAVLRWTLAGTLTVPLRTATPSPWAGGATFSSVSAPVSSPSGRVALFATRVAGEAEEAAGGPVRAALWIGDADALEEKLVFAGAVPGAAGELVFAAPFAEPAADEGLLGLDSEVLRINDAGAVAFVRAVAAPSDETNRAAVFGPGLDGAPRLRLLVGEPAPGIPDATLAWLALEHLSDDGDLLVRAGIDVGSGLATEIAFLRVPRTGAPQLLLRSTDLLEVVAGFPQPSGAHTLSFDRALTRVAFRSDGPIHDPGTEAIFVAAVPVPEPVASLGGFVAAIAVGALGRRRAVRAPH